MVVSFWNHQFTHVRLPRRIGAQKMDPEGAQLVRRPGGHRACGEVQLRRQPVPVNRAGR